jgi:hypothetical protein
VARPPPGSALGAPARHGRADAGHQPRINRADLHSDLYCTGHLPRRSIVQLAATASRALPAVASHAIGYADPRPGVHSRGFGAYEEMAQSRLSLSRVEVTDRDDMPLGLHDPRAGARRAEAVLDPSAVGVVHEAAMPTM